VIYIYSCNLGSVDSSIVVMTLMVAVTTAALLNFLCAVSVRNWQKGALITDFILFSSYLWTSAIDTICPWIYGSPLGKIFALAIIASIVVTSWKLSRFLNRTPELRRWTAIANLSSLLLLFIPVMQIVVFQITSAHRSHPLAELPEQKATHHIRPDVYYIILDGYTSSSILAKDLGYDNSAFTNYLSRKGFFVARKSRSNYAYTYLSLASSLNMNYIKDLDDAPDQQQECIRRIHESSVMRLFRANGYRVIQFAPNWLVNRQNPYSETTFNPRVVNEFENLVLKRFLLRSFLKQGIMSTYKARTLYTLHCLQTMPEDRHSTFVFAHILSPHPPFVFDRKGNTPELQPIFHRPPGSHDWYPKERYTDQIHYLNQLIEETIDQILRKSENPPIIIIQGDHGAACDGTSDNPSPLMVRERMGIMNAYYVPMEMRKRLYPSITPVNTFRLIANYLFTARFTSLPDKSYYSGPMDATPYKFVDIKTLLPGDK
jgi:hypothetical protein